MSAYNLRELLSEWCDLESGLGIVSSEWIGTASRLFAILSEADGLKALVKHWSPPKMVTALTNLARTAGSGVEFVKGSARRFKISREKLRIENLEGTI